MTSVSHSSADTMLHISLIPLLSNWLDMHRRNLGDVCTNHHAVSLRVKSLLDSCNEGLDEHENSDQSSTQVDDEDEAASVMQVDACLHQHFAAVAAYRKTCLCMCACICIFVWFHQRQQQNHRCRQY